MYVYANDMKRILEDNLRRVRQRIAAACERVRRDPDSVSLVAVTKYVDVDVIRVLLELGVTDIGENRAQELVRRATVIGETHEGRGGGGTRWHMIGGLQRNKVKSLLPHVTLIHSVDRLRLAEEINKRAGELGLRTDVLLEVNGGNEPQKSGAAVCAAGHLGEQMASMAHIRLRGLMTMAPFGLDPQSLRNIYARVFEAFDEMRHDFAVGDAFDTYSAGMTQDFELAVECGATMVRVGTALLEGVARRGEATASPAGGQ